MEAELLEPESSTGPKKSRFKRDEPPLAAETRGGRERARERETCGGVSVIKKSTLTISFSR